ncbi:MAG TPA: LysR family transcriptional regulator [Bosea sp. (in: a-proteobacteria)]|jgi:DNA-binding transcriptional LysR family regulator|uniref:LysR family transcriptional regulator n=1 Tax=Bosea sp. (in: a-proteobacteria) TaxID=1871050 RepID=UPI002DDCC36A|nr:LysR family transcriptional regulator [Bosea sp. (in: a-proteobacteria)]HEV2553552.1 LysR family transcriptional regulator [Bosea sp. (in: a-proteobacteria)]
MSDLRRMVSSSNALFVFEAAARSGSFTRAADELNVTQPAVSRMLSRFESHLGLRLFERGGKGAVLTPEGEILYRRVADGFRSIEAGLREVERLRGGKETVTISVSSAFTTHWLMPRMDRFQSRFPQVDLRFQMIAGSLRGVVENVDLGMRFVGADEPVPADALVVREIMLPVCSPGYRCEPGAAEPAPNGNTVIQLTDAPSDWAEHYAPFATGRSGPAKTLTFSDYAVVVQAALLGQGIAFGWITVVSHALMSGALVPAAQRLTVGDRLCVLLTPRNRPARPLIREIRDWIIAELRAEIAAIDRLHPGLGLAGAAG